MGNRRRQIRRPHKLADELRASGKVPATTLVMNVAGRHLVFQRDRDAARWGENRAVATNMGKRRRPQPPTHRVW
jgi:hypothetical protein